MDEWIRNRQRRAHEEGPAAEAALLLDRLRAGKLLQLRLSHAALLGHQPARDALGGDYSYRSAEDWRADVRSMGRLTLLKAVVVVAEVLLVKQERKFYEDAPTALIRSYAANPLAEYQSRVAGLVFARTAVEVSKKWANEPTHENRRALGAHWVNGDDPSRPTPSRWLPGPWSGCDSLKAAMVVLGDARVREIVRDALVPWLLR